MESAASQIKQTWLHSHEEDSADEMVFRPAAFPFPRSRGRAGYEFRPDGSVVVSGPGPADKPGSATGRWEMKDPGELLVTIPGEPDRSLKVASIAPDKLVLTRRS
jgi:hypothetical protein